MHMSTRPRHDISTTDMRHRPTDTCCSLAAADRALLASSLIRIMSNIQRTVIIAAHVYMCCCVAEVAACPSHGREPIEFATSKGK